MKKSIIALMGLFTLFACSDEVIQDMDKQSENPEIPMSVYTSDPNIPYDSPYDYFFNTGAWTSDISINNSTDLTIKIIPHFGSGFYDGAIDNLLFGNPEGSGFPNFHPLGGPEYGHTIVANDHFIPSFSSYAIDGFTFSATGPSWPYFDVSNVPFITSSFEYHFIIELCKLYYFEYEVYDSNNNHIFSGTLRQKIGDDTLVLSEILANGQWEYIGDLANMTEIAVVSEKETREICLVPHENGFIIPSEETFYDPSTNTMHTIKFYTDANGVYIDVN